MTATEKEPVALDDSSVYFLEEPPDPTIAIRGANDQPFVTIHLNTSELTYGPGYTPDHAARSFWHALTFWNTLGAVNTDDAPRQGRLALLADQLCRSYTYGVGLAELEKTNPGGAEAHRKAAERLLPWLRQAPEQEVKAAFDRGWAKGRESAMKNPRRVGEER
ncbi:hypothetical protein [Streptomyces lateritius]|uniref:hypothetical protein n=1 Tax=Streptomyces lateritius TaxID=67313 RepID=UPI001672911B|nr:hypothetical protein [Streptomyces lateritius]GGU01148.1 hypothetical protein GCM10010272_52550 [Streptomyces lateritius]